MGTAESIAIHASRRHNGIAFSFGDREITYATLRSDLRFAVKGLTALGVRPGSLVAIGVDDPYSHCLLLIALEQLGAGAASFSSNEGEQAAALLSRVDLVLAASAHDIAGARRLHALPSDWLDAFRGSETADNPAPRFNSDDPVRIARTSGTTGATKILIIPRRQHDARLERYAEIYGFDTQSRYLATMPLSIFMISASVMACLRSGGAVVFASQQSWLGSPGRMWGGITHAALTPLHLKTILNGLPDDFSKPEQLTIYTFGAEVSAALRVQALDRLATRVIRSYGSNETGMIARMRAKDEDGSGSIWPGVEVQVVDEKDTPVPSGAVGRIRVRSELMVEGYLDDPEATRRMFKDGWFYPGDSGVIDSPGRLKVLGRTDDLLNIGGTKYPPEYLERRVAQDPAILDVGVCSLRNPDGIDQVWVAAVAAEVRNDELRKRVLRTLQDLPLGVIQIVKINAIPRNDAGKIRRDRLRASLRIALGDL